MKKLSLLLILFLAIISTAYGQKKYEKSFYGGIFYISDYIASPEFENFKENENHIALVDSIYKKVLSFFEGDISETLLTLTFSTLPYNQIKTKFLFGTTLIFPLPSPSQKVFEARLKNLPSQIFFDSPKTDFGDKDKLPHFFGNAFISYNLGFFNLSKFMGIFVETVEEGIFIEGGYSSRDVAANYLGELFAEMLKRNKKAIPSSALKIYQLLFFRLI